MARKKKLMITTADQAGSRQRLMTTNQAAAGTRQKRGKLDQHEIFELIPDTPANIDVLEQLYTELAEDDIELDRRLPNRPPTKSRRRVGGRRGPKKLIPDDNAYMDDIADDSVRLVLARNRQNPAA